MRSDSLATLRAALHWQAFTRVPTVLPVKEDRRSLIDTIGALPWKHVPVAHSATDKGHGRITTRTIQILPAQKDSRSCTSTRCSSSSGTSLTCTMDQGHGKVVHAA